MLELRVSVVATLTFVLSTTAPVWAEMETTQGTVSIEEMAAGFDTPWAFTFLPDGTFLVTERDGALWRVVNGERHRVAGLPPIVADGQGGLLDVVAARDFSQSRMIFLTFSKSQGSGSGTAVARAILSSDAQTLTDVEVIFEAAPGASGGRHFGSRLVEGADGHLYVSLGERGDRPSAQDLGREQGSIIRITRDGRIPEDNPFVTTEGARPAIWSYGHRNPQGLAMDADGQIWSVEHGAKGGDEVNKIQRGANYGWPVISYGTHYSGRKIGEGIEKDGMMQPAWYWDPSIAPSGMLIYSGTLWPEWKGDIFVGSLKFDYISRLSGAPLSEVEQLRAAQTGRVRDIREAPDGSIWFASEYEGAIYRLFPN